MDHAFHAVFLSHLVKHEVRFLVVGSQAWRLIDGRKANDLDIWIDTEGSGLQAIRNALTSWDDLYPDHSARLKKRPLPLKSGLQVKVPEQRRDVPFIALDGSINMVGPNKCADLLLGQLGELEFETCHDESLSYSMDYGEVRTLSRKHLEVADKYRNYRQQ